MKFLALQTDIGLLKKQFVPVGEHEILTVARHPVKFVATFVIYTILFFALTFLLAWAGLNTTDRTMLLLIGAMCIVLLVVYIYELIKSYIGWRYNFLIISSDKIVIIEHQSFLHQNVNTVHLENIMRCHVESQFFGLLRCGKMEIRLDEKLQGTSNVIMLRYIPAPDTVASAIENAIALRSQLAKGTDTPKQEEKKAEAIKENIKEQVADAKTAVIVEEKKDSV